MVNNLYETCDLGVAVFLLCSGHTLHGTKLVAPNRIVFEINRKDVTDALVRSYRDGSGTAPARQLFETYKSLRALTFERTNNRKK